MCENASWRRKFLIKKHLQKYLWRKFEKHLINSSTKCIEIVHFHYEMKLVFYENSDSGRVAAIEIGTLLVQLSE
jgi:hypothetical protein